MRGFAQAGLYKRLLKVATQHAPKARDAAHRNAYQRLTAGSPSLIKPNSPASPDLVENKLFRARLERSFYQNGTGGVYVNQCVRLVFSYSVPSVTDAPLWEGFFDFVAPAHLVSAGDVEPKPHKAVSGSSLAVGRSYAVVTGARPVSLKKLRRQDQSLSLADIALREPGTEFVLQPSAIATVPTVTAVYANSMQKVRSLHDMSKWEVYKIVSELVSWSPIENSSFSAGRNVIRGREYQEGYVAYPQWDPFTSKIYQP